MRDLLVSRAQTLPDAVVYLFAVVAAPPPPCLARSDMLGNLLDMATGLLFEAQVSRARVGGESAFMIRTRFVTPQSLGCKLPAAIA